MTKVNNLYPCPHMNFNIFLSPRMWLDEPGQHPADGGQHPDRQLGSQHGRWRQQLLSPRQVLPRGGIRTLLPVIQHLLQG